MEPRIAATLRVGDTIMVCGQYFVLTECGLKLDKPAYVIFKQPLELVQERRSL